MNTKQPHPFTLGPYREDGLALYAGKEIILHAGGLLGAGHRVDEQLANVERAAVCMNACAGMDNPAEEIVRLQKVDAARESELERMIQWMEDKGISWLATLRDIKEARIAMQKGASVMGCPNCDGTGFYGSTSCSECRGTGHAKAEGGGGSHEHTT